MEKMDEEDEPRYLYSLVMLLDKLPASAELRIDGFAERLGDLKRGVKLLPRKEIVRKMCSATKTMGEVRAGMP